MLKSVLAYGFILLALLLPCGFTEPQYLHLPRNFVLGIDSMPADPGLLKVIRQSKKEKGRVVIRVYEGSPSQKAGLKEGDLIVAIDDTPLSDAEDINILMTKPPGTVFQLTILRKDQRLTLPFTTIAPPETPYPGYLKHYQDMQESYQMVKEGQYQEYLGNIGKARKIKEKLREWTRLKIQESMDEGHLLQAELYRLMLKDF